MFLHIFIFPLFLYLFFVTVGRGGGGILRYIFSKKFILVDCSSSFCLLYVLSFVSTFPRSRSFTYAKSSSYLCKYSTLYTRPPSISTFSSFKFLSDSFPLFLPSPPHSPFYFLLIIPSPSHVSHSSTPYLGVIAASGLNDERR